MKYWESDEFRELQSEWYRKAAESGYKDIEYSEGTDILDGTTEAQIASQADRWGAAETLDYYCRAEHWTSHIRARRGASEAEKKRAKRDRDIWRLHAQGAGNRSIAKKVGVHYSRVDQIIWRERARMLNYKPETK